MIIIIIIRTTKLLGLYFNENITWNDHTRWLCSVCYGTLTTLKKIKNFAPFYLRRQLAEQPVLSKMDYGDLVFNPLQDYLVKWLQKIQFSAASFVSRRYVNSIETLLTLGWLPCIKLSILRTGRTILQLSYTNQLEICVHPLP